MDTEPDKKLSDLKDRLDAGEYSVDPRAVADAILRRSRDAAIVRAELAHQQILGTARHAWIEQLGDAPDGRHTECSKPDSRRVASRNLTPGSPGMTRPIQVISRAGSACLSAVSTTLRALGGTHVHSS